MMCATPNAERNRHWHDRQRRGSCELDRHDDGGRCQEMVACVRGGLEARRPRQRSRPHWGTTRRTYPVQAHPRSRRRGVPVIALEIQLAMCIPRVLTHIICKFVVDPTMKGAPPDGNSMLFDLGKNKYLVGDRCAPYSVANQGVCVPDRKFLTYHTLRGR
jgi:hypothetical protein